MLNVRPSSRAGSLPQGEWSRAQRLRYHQSNCGSEPARDSGVSGNKDVRFQTVIVSRLAPTRGVEASAKAGGITNQTVVASLLAIAECQATKMLNVRPSSRAGSLPRGEWSRGQRLRYHQSNCGGEPARDSGVSGNKDVECRTVIASRLAPTRGVESSAKAGGITNQTVGASLLAIAECQATEMLNVRPTSRAGSLPRGEWSRAQRLAVSPIKLWERACSR